LALYQRYGYCLFAQIIVNKGFSVRFGESVMISQLAFQVGKLPLQVIVRGRYAGRDVVVPSPQIGYIALQTQTGTSQPFMHIITLSCGVLFALIDKISPTLLPRLKQRNKTLFIFVYQPLNNIRQLL
jgi:hypothetical protein